MMPLDVDAIRNLAEGYTAAWCSHSAEGVGSFFDENATSIINDGTPAVGRAAIIEAMQAFFADFPDLSMHMDGLRSAGNRVVYLWTLEGTNSGPGGTGNFVRVSGWLNWRLSDEALVTEAEGRFDAAEYDRQIREGI